MKTHKNKFKQRMSILAGIAMFAMIAMGTLAYVAPDSFASIITCLSGSGGVTTAMFLLPSMVIQRMPGEAGGGGVMTPEAKAALFNEIKTECKTNIEAFIKDNPDIVKLMAYKTTIEELQTKLNNATKPEDVEKIKTELSAAILDIKALKEINVGGDRGIAKGSIAETLAANKEKIEAFKKAGAGTLIIEHKATETSTDIADRENTFFGFHQPGQVGQLPVRRPFMRELFTQVNTESEFIKYIDQATTVRDAKNVSLCGVTTHNTKVTWEPGVIQIQKVRDFVDICLDMINDYGFVQAEINNLLNTSVELKIDDGLLLGDGSAPNLNGIDSIASSFSASASGADYAALIPFATIIDLISIAGAQVRSFGIENMWFPNFVLVNPKDMTLMKLLKDQQRNYITPNFIRPSLIQEAGGRWMIDGMMLVENPLVPENEFYIGDFSKAFLYQKPGIGIEFSYENRSNFETETVTAKAYRRLNSLIRNVDADAFMHVEDIQQAIFDISYPT